MNGTDPTGHNRACACGGGSVFLRGGGSRGAAEAAAKPHGPSPSRSPRHEPKPPTATPARTSATAVGAAPAEPASGQALQANQPTRKADRAGPDTHQAGCQHHAAGQRRPVHIQLLFPHRDHEQGTSKEPSPPARPPHALLRTPIAGHNAKPAPTRPAPKPDWNPKNSGWKPGDAVRMTPVDSAPDDRAGFDRAHTPTPAETSIFFRTQPTSRAGATRGAAAMIEV